jgi:hypothetical protein
MCGREHKKKQRYKQRAAGLKEQMKVQAMEIARLQAEVRRVQQHESLTSTLTED